MNTELIKKYNIPSPRYTSYPTVPYWNTAEFDKYEHLKRLVASYQKDKAEGLSLYIHLPYCESLCTYCGCNKRITKNHKVEGPYIKAVLEEWRMYVELLGEKPKLAELHLGGGTPTFFTSENLGKLMDGILAHAVVSEKAQFSFEGHPNNTTEEHLRELRKKGFNRVSFGIQDFDPVVQRTINRMQSFAQVRKVTQDAKALGYRSINYDLIYGLPKQTMEGMLDTFDKVLVLNPDRIAFYSYAHVPWKSPSQRGYDESDLPDENMKIALYNAGKEKLLNNGYVEIGMDHFAKPNDGLALASQHGEMHRNFMGYTEAKNDTLIGLGVSAISDAWSSLAQNPISVEAYLERIEKGEFPIVKGHLHTERDLTIRKAILDLMCGFNCKLDYLASNERELVVNRLSEHLADNLLTIDKEGIHVKPEGQAFIRTICMALDEFVWTKQSGQQMFSKSV
ncbi:MAG: oxygen-independent coproporphyrinogen III oxidase [Flavobacteriales bacterium]|nr:oxygen-independent coproporphyrinogen III oxidase [Flavobacteriales bacterium]